MKALVCKGLRSEKRKKIGEKITKRMRIEMSIEEERNIIRKFRTIKR